LHSIPNENGDGWIPLHDRVQMQANDGDKRKVFHSDDALPSQIVAQAFNEGKNLDADREWMLLHLHGLNHA
jgi:hypothetical protein